MSKAYGTYPADPKWNWSADIDFNLKVDLKDYFAVSRSFGKTISCISMDDISNRLKAVFYRQGGQIAERYSDQWGCFSDLPSGADKFRLYLDGKLVGGVVEFFRSAFHEGDYTDSNGRARFSWVPDETGNIAYNLEPGALKPYFMSVWVLPSSRVLASQWINATAVKATMNLVRFLNVTKRAIDLSVEFTPSEPTLDDTVTLIASCCDPSLGEPSEGWPVDFLLYGRTMPYGEMVYVYIGWNITDSSGVAQLSFVSRVYYENASFLPYFYGVAVSLETNCTLYCEAHVLIDTRYPTRLEHLGEDAMQVPVGKAVDVSCRLVRADNGDPVVGRLVQLYVNDTWLGNDVTNESGVFGGSVTIYESGLYFFRAQFSWGEGLLDELYEDSNNVTFVIVAAVVPVFVLFEIEPKEFKPGATITLKATVYNAKIGRASCRERV